MKYVLSCVIILLLAIVIVTGFVSIQFDSNIIRPQIVDYFETEYNLEADIGNMSLNWRNGIGINISNLIVNDIETTHPLMKANQVFVALDLISFLKRICIVKNISIDNAEIFVLRHSNGSLNWNLWSSEGAGSVPAKISYNKSAGGELKWNQDLQEVQVNRLTLSYLDYTLTPTLYYKFQPGQFQIQQDMFKRIKMFNFKTLSQSRGSQFLELEGIYQQEIDTLSLSISYNQDEIKIDGEIENIREKPVFKGNVYFHQLDIDTNRGAGDTLEHGLQGVLTGSLEGRVTDLQLSKLTDNIFMTGAVDARKGAILNVNIVSEVLKGIVPVPGWTEKLFNDVPADLKAILTGSNTAFDMFQGKLVMKERLVSSQEISLNHADYLMTASGSYGVTTTEDIHFDARIIFLERMSDYLTSKIQQFDHLKNTQGRIVIPFQMLGKVNGALKIKPELGFIAKKILKGQSEKIVSAGTSLVDELIGE